MNFLWLYQLHTFWLGVLIVGLFVGSSVASLALTRPLAKRLCREQNDFVNFFFATIGVFYAVLVGLIAVAVWGNYAGIDGIVSNEAVNASDVYRDVESYPPAVRDEVRGSLRAYVNCVGRREWPAQKRGAKLGDDGDLLLQKAAQGLTTFEPTTPGQQVVHVQTLRDLDDLFSNRRLRLEAVDSHLPGLMWLVVLVGAAVLMLTACFFCADSNPLHYLLTIGLSVLVGLVIFLILALDRPLVGTVSVDASSFEDALPAMGGAPVRRRLPELRRQPRRGDQLREFPPALLRPARGAAALLDVLPHEVLAEVVVDHVAPVLIDEADALGRPLRGHQAVAHQPGCGVLARDLAV